MPEQHLYEYAIVRVVPQVEREEFLNVGVVLYCAKMRFLQLKYKIDPARMIAFSAKADPEQLEICLKAFELICNGGTKAGPIGKLPIAERFRWLTATRSTVLQVSKVHPGFCEDASNMLDRIFIQQVL